MNTPYAPRMLKPTPGAKAVAQAAYYTRMCEESLEIKVEAMWWLYLMIEAYERQFIEKLLASVRRPSR